MASPRHRRRSCFLCLLRDGPTCSAANRWGASHPSHHGGTGGGGDRTDQPGARWNCPGEWLAGQPVSASRDSDAPRSLGCAGRRVRSHGVDPRPAPRRRRCRRALGVLGLSGLRARAGVRGGGIRCGRAPPPGADRLAGSPSGATPAALRARPGNEDRGSPAIPNDGSRWDGGARPEPRQLGDGRLRAHRRVRCARAADSLAGGPLRCTPRLKWWGVSPPCQGESVSSRAA